MGCHTWFSVPLTKDKEEIKKLGLEAVKKSYNGEPIYSKDFLIVMQYAVENELMDFIAEYAAVNNDARYIDNALYIDVSKWSLLQYNKEHKTNYESIYDNDVYNKIKLESYSDEPRIGGYPENIIHSYDKMVEFMKTGFTDKDGKHFDFYYEESRKDSFMNGIKKFFELHPDGIITFG